MIKKPTKKPIIAIDVDDVLSDSLDALRIEVNKRVGADLQRRDYHIAADYEGYFLKVWEKYGLEGRITMEDLNADKTHSRSAMVPVGC